MTDDLCARLNNLYLETDLCVLDCLGEVAGIGGYEEVLKNSMEVELPAGKFRMLDLDGLIRAKEAMGRPHDHLTVVQLRAIKERKTSDGG